MPKISAVILAVLICVFAGILIGKLKENYDPEIFSENYISVDEVKQELIFTVYSQEEWDEWFEGGKKDYLTGAVLDELLKRLGVSEQIDFSEKRKNAAVSRTEWNQVYAQILAFLDMEQSVKKETLLVLNRMEMEDQTVLVTNQGDFYTKLQNTYFTDWMSYDVYIKEDQCIGIAQVSEQEQTIENAYLKSCQDEKISFLFAGAVYEKELQERWISCEPGVCDLVFRDGALTAIKTKQDIIQGQMLSYDDSEIEIEDYGRIHHNGKLPVYQTYGDVSEKSISDVVLGNMNVAYVTAGKEVCAILILQPADIKNIRVLLLSDDGTNTRSDVYLKCSTNADITCGDETKSAGSEELLHPADTLTMAPGKTFIVKPESEDGKIYLCNGNGTAVSNGYAGTIEVRSTENGYTVVNELPLEEYLYAVVPSEMPSSFSPEALKTQAVCARSYVYMQLMRADLAAYGAHINDSTSYQVYNKVEKTKESVAAVDATCGQVLTWNGKVVEAYYFSTSAGVTSTDEIWGSDEAAPYLRSVPCKFDEEEPWSSWIVELPWKMLEDRIREKGEGTVLRSVTVTRRSESGAATALEAVSDKDSCIIENEYEIRKFLAPVNCMITEKDGTETAGGSLLPSAYFELERTQNGNLQVRGKGYGHGVGMSQTGADKMAEQGYDYREILDYFFRNITVENLG